MRIVTVVPLTPALEVAQAHEECPDEGRNAEADEQRRLCQGVFRSSHRTNQHDDAKETAEGRAKNQPEAHRMGRREPLAALGLSAAAQERI
ncbi:hypothetical protein ACTWPT_51025 [Nonomuraea sp. 3N208]|uniref:hypothetical protein n=1 Tax=Nonomuraea sp. 3N208 TaxID=3457421 RepID=UPI003FD67586